MNYIRKYMYEFIHIYIWENFIDEMHYQSTLSEPGVEVLQKHGRVNLQQIAPCCGSAGKAEQPTQEFDPLDSLEQACPLLPLPSHHRNPESPRPVCAITQLLRPPH